MEQYKENKKLRAEKEELTKEIDDLAERVGKIIGLEEIITSEVEEKTRGKVLGGWPHYKRVAAAPLQRTRA